MDFPTPKELKKLADTCRKVGIKTFKCAQFEFTLTEDIPLTPYQKAKEIKQLHTQGKIESDELTEDQLIEWSTGGSEANI